MMVDPTSTWTPYCGVAPTPADLWLRWNLDPLLLGALTTIGAVLLWRAASARRGLALAAMAVVVVAFVSPLCALSSALFSARTVHHLLLAAAAAPLIAWTLPGASKPRGRVLFAAPLLFAVAFWAWHAPRLYGWALSSDLAYWLMQTSVLGSATTLWWSVRVASPPTAVAILLATMVQMGLLGALLVFLPEAIYAPHALSTAAWGLSPLADQQIAGLIMWAPAAAIYLIAALVILGGWLTGAPRRLHSA
jgi:putative membrane protein